MPKLLNKLLASCPFINLDFLLARTAHFDDNIIIAFLVFHTFESTFCALLMHFKQYDHIFYNDCA